MDSGNPNYVQMAHISDNADVVIRYKDAIQFIFIISNSSQLDLQNETCVAIENL